MSEDEIEKAIEIEWEEGQFTAERGVGTTEEPADWDLVARFRQDIENDFKEYAQKVCKRLLASGQFISVKELREKIEKLKHEELIERGILGMSENYYRKHSARIGMLDDLLSLLPKSQEKKET